jgi:uridine kinase
MGTVITMRSLAERVDRQPPPGMPVRVVAIDGPGGAGKSTLAARLAVHLDDAPIVHTDDFATWDVPLDWWPRMVEQVLTPIAHGGAARYQRYDWDTEQLAEWVDVPVAHWLVLEGVSASRAAFRPFLAASIWVDTDRDLCLARGLERDGAHLRERWQGWMADEDRHFAAERPERHADLVVAGDSPHPLAPDEIVVLRMGSLGAGAV